jgi:hypothetical protein
VPTVSGRVESVTDLVADKKIVKIFVDVLPERKTEHTIRDVEERGVMVGLLNRNVFVCEQAREDRFFS